MELAQYPMNNFANHTHTGPFVAMQQVKIKARVAWIYSQGVKKRRRDLEAKTFFKGGGGAGKVRERRSRDRVKELPKQHLEDFPRRSRCRPKQGQIMTLRPIKPPMILK
jgi:hypothetical protein